MNQFSDDQQFALDAIDRMVKARHGVMFLTGEAGTGKSHVTKESSFRHKIIKLGTTGLAAVLQGGQTVNSFINAGIGVPMNADGSWDVSTMKNMIKEHAAALNAADAVLVDEAFMLRVEMVDMMDMKFRRATGVNKLFGGKPVIFCGDPWQIEPIVASDAESEMIKRFYNGNPYIWGARCLHGVEPIAVELTQVFRQAGDPEFRDTLNRIRKGSIMGLDRLSPRVARWDKKSVCITFTNRRADIINDYHLGMLDGPTKSYTADNPGLNSRDLPAPERIELKVGARVLLRANTPDYVNGDAGEVTSLGECSVMVRLDRTELEVEVKENEWQIHRYSFTEDEGFGSKVVATYRQLPIILGWAITTHKSQGQTYDRAHIEMESRPHAAGLFYVAVSRVKTLDGLTLGRAPRPSDVRTNPEVKKWELLRQEKAA